MLNVENVDLLLDLVTRVDDLVYRKATGTPAELAEKLGSSERTVYRFINKLKSLDLPIAYSRQRKTYYYTQLGRMRIGFSPEE